jgi:hypothetical protein
LPISRPPDETPEHLCAYRTKPIVALDGQRLYDLGHPTPWANAKAMSINPTPRIVTELKPKFEIKVDLDERSFLFPAGKSISQLLLLSDGRTIFIEAIYPFNQSRTPPRLLRLTSKTPENSVDG